MPAVCTAELLNIRRGHHMRCYDIPSAYTSDTTIASGAGSEAWLDHRLCLGSSDDGIVDHARFSDTSHSVRGWRHQLLRDQKRSGIEYWRKLPSARKDRCFADY